MDEVPVGPVKNRPECVLERVGCAEDARHRRHHNSDHCDEEEQCRQETPGSATPKAPQADSARGAPLRQEQGRDKKAR